MSGETILNSSIEIHDSRLESVERQGEKIILRLSPAYIHKSIGEPGVNVGTGWIQDALVIIEQLGAKPTTENLPVYLSNGTLRIDNKEFPNTIPLPMSCQGSIVLDLLTMENERISMKGSSIRVELLGEPVFVEEFKV
jgi:hypothetical protein